MSQDSLWPDGTSGCWIDALRLPTLAWVRPLLPWLGLPPRVGADPEVLRGPCETLAATLARLRRAVTDMDPLPGLDGAMTREAVIHAMHALGDALGGDVAADFERWARAHVVACDMRVELFAWRMILLGLLHVAPDRQDPPPAPLAARTPLVERTLGEPRARRLDDDIREHAPPASHEEQSLGLDVAADAAEVKEIAWSQLTIEALDAIGAELDDGQRDDVARWASRRARTMTAGNAPDPSGLRRHLDPGERFADLRPAVCLPIPHGPVPGDADGNSLQP